jgi:hypothetical protein
VRYEFATAETPKLRFGIPAGRIVIETTDGETTIVDVEAIRGDLDDLKVEQHGRDIVIETRKKFGRNHEFDIRVRSPHGPSGRNVASETGPPAARRAEVNTHRRRSGRAGRPGREDPFRERRAARAVGGRADVNTASGDVQIESVAGGGTIRSPRRRADRRGGGR